MGRGDYSELNKKIERLRSIVVELKGPLEGISVCKKTKKVSKKNNEVTLSSSNVMEKE